MDIRTKSVADLRGNAAVKYFFKMLQRHSGLSDAKNSLRIVSTGGSPTIFYHGRKISVPFLEEGTQMPLVLYMDGGRDSTLANVVDATTRLWNKSPFCTYDVAGLQLPTYEWAKTILHPLDNPERRIADLRQTFYIHNLQILGKPTSTPPVTEFRISSGQGKMNLPYD